MSDLISRKETYNELIESIDWLRERDYELYCVIGDSIRVCINEQPTAYDVDKVAEEIKTLKEEALVEYNMGEYNLDNNIGNRIAENYRKDMNEGRCFAYDDAIEIVKQGEIK